MPAASKPQPAQDTPLQIALKEFDVDAVKALLAAGALAWPTWGVSCCLAIPYVCRQRRKREKRHEKEKAEARALSNPSLSPQQKRARVTLGSSRRIRDCLHHLGFSVRKKPSLAWGQLRYVFHDRVDGVTIHDTGSSSSRSATSV